MSKKIENKEARERLYQVIRSPLITEKSTQGSEHNKVSFKVCKTSTKKEIREAVEALFGVNVKAVNTINVLGKIKVFKGRKGKRSDYKKAIVSLVAGQNIDVMSGVK
jgi:large subunit ribosomal protein L23